MIPLVIPNLMGREADYLQECVASNFVSTIGPFVDRFEGMIAASTNAKYAVATSSGTSALHLALLSVGVGRDDLVILPSFTFIASANAISHCGASPWLMDIDRESWSLDVNLLKKMLRQECRITKNTVHHIKTNKRVAAILPVFTMGLPSNMQALIAIADDYNLPIVADAAAALGATYQGEDIGKLNIAFSTLSFNGNKTVTAGGGGALISNDEKLSDLARHLSSTARVGKDYTHDMISYNYRMTNLQAAVGCAQMENLHYFLQRKGEIRAFYEDALQGIKNISFFPNPPWATSANWLSGFVLERGDGPLFQEKLQKAGIGTSPFWKPVHLQKPYENALFTPQHICENIWDKIITLPSSSGISDDDLQKVAQFLNKALRPDNE